MLSTFLLPFLVPAAYAQLNDLAKAAGLKYFGTATDNSELGDSAYAKILSNTAEFGQITPGNSQKWDATEPSRGRFTFSRGDQIASLAQKNSQLLRCHLLVWHNQLPSWAMDGKLDSKTLEAVMRTHITNEVEHYKGQCYSWDVVNEALDDDSNFRQFSFYNAMGEDYIKIAFEAAALADPSAKLYYNDYNIEYSGAKATAALSIVTKLVNQGVKIDGVGLQGHFIVGSMPLHDDFVKTMRTYTSLGLDVAFTEMDIRMPLPATPARLAQQSLDYENIVSACVAVDNCIGITVWDFDDKYSWVPGTFPGIGAACLFDGNLNRKPAYDGVVKALKSNRVVQSSTRAATTVSATLISLSSSKTVARVSTTSSLSSASATIISSSSSSLATVAPVSTTSYSSSSTLISSTVIFSSPASKSTTVASTTPIISSAISATSSAFGSSTLVSNAESTPLITSSDISIPSITSTSTDTAPIISTTPISSSAIFISGNSSTALTTYAPSGMTTSYIPVSKIGVGSESVSTVAVTASSLPEVSPTSTTESIPKPTGLDTGDAEDDGDEACE